MQPPFAAASFRARSSCAGLSRRRSWALSSLPPCATCFFEEASAASIDALCPFGGVETLWQWVTTGEFVPKTHPSSLVLMVGLLLATMVSGAAFCGWICPFGTLQDALTWLRERLRIPAIARARKRWTAGCATAATSPWRWSCT